MAPIVENEKPERVTSKTRLPISNKLVGKDTDTLKKIARAYALGDIADRDDLLIALVIEINSSCSIFVLSTPFIYLLLIPTV